jgi:hypothetical protein
MAVPWNTTVFHNFCVVVATRCCFDVVKRHVQSSNHVEGTRGDLRVGKG